VGERVSVGLIPQHDWRIEMDRYQITLTGMTPLIMHQDNLAFSEKIKSWQKDPANKKDSIAGDDRSPPWTWLGYLYHDKKVIGIPADNIMTNLREGGTQMKTGRQGKSNETFKKQTQSGVIIDHEQFEVLINGKTIDVAPLDKLIGEIDFSKHITAAETAGFELLVKRAKIGQSKHVRVRPLFRNWVATGTLTVIDSELSGLTKDVLQKILDLSGAVCGLCDWRPSSPKASGTFGKFTPTLKLIK
jgi:hypothetical protein